MTEKIDELLAFAASAAAAGLVADMQTFADVFEDALDEKAARFVRLAGDVSGEALFRWLAGKERHPFKGEEWPKISEDFRRFFDGFAAVVKALTPIVAPPQPAPGTIIHPAAQKVDVEDTIFRKYGRPGEKVGHGLDPSTPASTVGLTIVPNAPAPVAPPPADPRPPAVPPIVIGRDALTRFERGAVPSQEEFMAMTPEERRPFAALFGMPGLDAIAAETVEGGETPPAAEDLAPMAIDAEVNGEKVAGTVAVGKVKGRGK